MELATNAYDDHDHAVGKNLPDSPDIDFAEAVHVAGAAADDSAKFGQIESQLNINAQKIQKIAINRCTMDDLKSFPYLRYKQANAIITYRTQHGNFSSATDLNKIAILTPELVQKITPYLNFND